MILAGYVPIDLYNRLRFCKISMNIYKGFQLLFQNPVQRRRISPTLTSSLGPLAQRLCTDDRYLQEEPSRILVSYIVLSIDGGNIGIVNYPKFFCNVTSIDNQRFSSNSLYQQIVVKRRMVYAIQDRYSNKNVRHSHISNSANGRCKHFSSTVSRSSELRMFLSPKMCTE